MAQPALRAAAQESCSADVAALRGMPGGVNESPQAPGSHWKVNHDRVTRPTAEEILARAREILCTEGDALRHAAERLDERFVAVVHTILALRGKVVLTGVGKSGNIAMKIAATLSSTGTPAFFMHSVEAVMGDLGILSRDDLIMAISNSGETNEVVNVVLAAGKIGTPAVAVTNNPTSTLARECRFLLPLHVGGEAGHLGLAPTTSTTVTLGLGDALAMVLMEAKQITREQFAILHPGGNLGRRLSLKVAELLRTGEEFPVVEEGAPVAKAIHAMSVLNPRGVTLVTDSKGQLAGIITDGDLRRLLDQGLRGREMSQITVREIMSKNPRTVERDALASEALRLMEVNGITQLAIVDGHGRPIGLIHIHDILGRAKFIL